MSRRALVLLATLALPALGVALGPPDVPVPHSAWRVETASAGYVPWPVAISLALRPDDAPALLSFDEAAGVGLAVLHERSVAGWSATILASDAEPLDLARDPAGSLHAVLGTGVTAHGVVAPDLALASEGPTGWSIAPIEVYGGAKGVTAARLAFDAAGAPHVLFRLSTGELRYAVRAGSWQVESVGAALPWFDLAIDPAGRPHAVYVAPAASGFTHALRSAGSWTRESVAGCASDLALAADAAGRLHVACRPAEGGVRLLVRDAAAWTAEDAVTGGELVPPRTRASVGFEISLALDAADRPHLAFRTRVPSNPNDVTAPSQLHYAREAGGRWTAEAVDRDGLANGFLPSLAVGADGFPRVAYGFSWRVSGVSAEAANPRHDLRYAEPVLAGVAAFVP